MRNLIRRLAAENPTWGQKRIADELLLKWQIQLSPSTVAKYIKQRPGPRGARDQRWSTFLKNHAKAIGLRFLHRGDRHFSRALRVCGVGDRIAMADAFQHDRTSGCRVDAATAARSSPRRSGLQVSAARPTLDPGLDEEVEGWGLEVLKSQAHSPTANAFCERVIGAIRRECLDFVIPQSESHLKRTLREWVSHYNSGRPHQSLGPGIPNGARRLTPPSEPTRIFTISLSPIEHLLKLTFVIGTMKVGNDSQNQSLNRNRAKA